MLAPPDPLDQASLGALLGRLTDDGKRFARAEVQLQIATVKARASRSIVAVGLFVAALLLVIAAVVVLVGALGALLAWAFGAADFGAVAGGSALAALIALAVAGICAKIGASSIAKAGKEPLA